jgi:hypothetical protein
LTDPVSAVALRMPCGPDRRCQFEEEPHSSRAQRLPTRLGAGKD